MIVWTNKDDGRGIWKEPEEKETKVGRYKEKKQSAQDEDMKNVSLLSVIDHTL